VAAASSSPSGCCVVSVLVLIKASEDQPRLRPIAWNDYPRWLPANAIVAPQFAGLVGELDDVAQTVAIDEIFHVLEAVTTWDTDDGEAVAEFCLCRCDRRGFTIARASPRSPEPQQDVLPGVSGVVEGDPREVGSVEAKHCWPVLDRCWP